MTQINEHLKKNPRVCPCCPYGPKAPSIILRHVVTHTDEMPFKCDDCDYKCKLQTNLKRHVQTFH